MPYVRISLVQPLPGKEENVRQLLAELADYYRSQPGHLAGSSLEHLDGSARLGRIGIWSSEEDAERAAQTQHDLALRARLNSLVEEDTHQEYSFEGWRNIDDTGALQDLNRG